eukprot:TRINITY_DN3088_c0_g2_i3.p2 TRINITY_DN3088_c0_g2~~TRINITY_DN3088_c0_g2_i3.p2  ORF type:complete len:165 (+),score=41.08 TRINITY_DN3088_c0_g2_i3:84-578(+)
MCIRDRVQTAQPPASAHLSRSDARAKQDAGRLRPQTCSPNSRNEVSSIVLHEEAKKERVCHSINSGKIRRTKAADLNSDPSRFHLNMNPAAGEGMLALAKGLTLDSGLSTSKNLYAKSKKGNPKIATKSLNLNEKSDIPAPASSNRGKTVILSTNQFMKQMNCI